MTGMARLERLRESGRDPRGVHVSESRIRDIRDGFRGCVKKLIAESRGSPTEDKKLGITKEAQPRSHFPAGSGDDAGQSRFPSRRDCQKYLHALLPIAVALSTLSQRMRSVLTW